MPTSTGSTTFRLHSRQALTTSPLSVNQKGFTLVELIVVIAIIAVLAVTGYAVYTGVTKAARDSKRKSDVESIAKAYEVKYNGLYSAVTSANFSGGTVPKDPDNTTDYFNVVDSVTGTGYKVCAALDNNPQRVCNTPASNCYCRVSAQGTIPTGIPTSNLTGTNTSYGMGGSSSQSCDPNGTLLSGLVGYWKMDENSWNGTSNEVIDLSGYNYHGTAGSGAVVIAGQSGFGNAGSFDGVDDKVDTSSNFNFASYTGFTISAWIKPNNTVTRQAIYNNGHGVSFEIESNSVSTKIRSSTQSPYWFSAGGGTINATSWQHVMLVYQKSQYFKLYRNGAEVASNNFGVDYGHSGDSNDYIGNSNPGFGVIPYNGKIDDVRIYNRALSSSEVTSLYNSGTGCVP